jgi:preprotein translocase subunit YajC
LLNVLPILAQATTPPAPVEPPPPAPADDAPPVENGTSTTLAPGAPVTTQPGTIPPPPDKVPPPWWLNNFMPLLLIIAIFYIFLFRSKKNTEKKRTDMLNQLKRGDRVQTIGGIIGNVVEAREHEVVLKVDESSNTKIRFARSAIHRVLDEDGKAEATKK